MKIKLTIKDNDGGPDNVSHHSNVTKWEATQYGVLVFTASGTTEYERGPYDDVTIELVAE